jgi:sulfate permease, SulP family
MSVKSNGDQPQGQLASGIMYGVINGILCIPVTVSFCAIIFRESAFAPFMPKLVKLVLFSSAVHQVVFSVFSSLPFAVGQVQDAGLIFLSAIAASIVGSCKHEHMIMATTLYTLSICTFLLGCMLLVTSRLKLASLVQYLPMPVIGGYLAYIGFFCGEAGLAMMGGIAVNTPQAYMDWHVLLLVLPGLTVGCVMYILLRNVRSPFVLPISMGVILVTFYSIMWLSGASFEDTRNFGWVAPLTPLGTC